MKAQEGPAQMNIGLGSRLEALTCNVSTTAGCGLMTGQRAASSMKRMQPDESVAHWCAHSMVHQDAAAP